ncbi:(2Fe-2S)-binding protein [Maricurvus nonylphenolicus]|uniref:(2Fe-2S)-binding protein n=1 Tax=Maricurvus nonylphenolicus TaxID=1008307 RepID=UPI0036F3DE04
MSIRKKISLTVNGRVVEREVEPRMLLADFLRNELNLTGTHVGCEHGICGACTLIMNGDSVRSCLTLAVQADGAEITTIEAHGKPDSMSIMQEKFQQCHGLQCGFCTPGMVATAEDMVKKYPLDSEEEIRDGLSGNICRCTGYQHIVDAVSAAKDEIRAEQNKA